MKFTCEKSSLSASVSIASRTVALKSTIPALEGLLIEARGAETVISGYDLKTGIRTRLEAEVSEPGSIVLNAKLFGDIVRKMPDDTVSFDCGADMMVHITCGMSSFDIMGTSAEDYPELPGVDTLQRVTVKEGVLKELIEETLFAVSTNEARPIHTGSLFEIEGEELTVVSRRLPPGSAPGEAGAAHRGENLLRGPRLGAERGGENRFPQRGTRGDLPG